MVNTIKLSWPAKAGTQSARVGALMIQWIAAAIRPGGPVKPGHDNCWTDS